MRKDLNLKWFHRVFLALVVGLILGRGIRAFHPHTPPGPFSEGGMPPPAHNGPTTQLKNLSPTQSIGRFPEETAVRECLGETVHPIRNRDPIESLTADRIVRFGAPSVSVQRWVVHFRDRGEVRRAVFVPVTEGRVESLFRLHLYAVDSEGFPDPVAEAEWPAGTPAKITAGAIDRLSNDWRAFYKEKRMAWRWDNGDQLSFLSIDGATQEWSLRRATGQSLGCSRFPENGLGERVWKCRCMPQTVTALAW